MFELVGFLLPPVIDLVNRKVNNPTLRFWITLAISLIMGAIIRWDEIGLGNPEVVLASAAIIFTESQIVYKTYWKDSGIRRKIIVKP